MIKYKRKKDTAILLLMGRESSGKTASAIAGFSTLAKGVASPKRTARFSLRTDEANERETVSTDHLIKAYQSMKKGKDLPGKTENNQIYSFRLEKNGREICRLAQLDYPSGLRSSKSPAEGQDEAFNSFLAHASILAFVLPGDLLQSYIQLGGKTLEEVTDPVCMENVLSINREINHIKTLLLKAGEINPHAPLLFYVTKSDLVAYPQNIPLVLERLLREWKLLDGNRKVLGCSSTLGKNAVINGNQIQSGFAPEGFEIPLLLAAARRQYVRGRKWNEKETRFIDGTIRRLTQERDEAAASRAALAVHLQTRLIKIFRPEKKAIRELDERIAQLDKTLLEKEKEKEMIPKRNPHQKHARDILSYIETAYPNEVLYINKKGQKRKLQNFI